jgi:hypothetical protein
MREEARAFAMKIVTINQKYIVIMSISIHCLQLRIFRQQWPKNLLESKNSHKL